MNTYAAIIDSISPVPYTMRSKELGSMSVESIMFKESRRIQSSVTSNVNLYQDHPTPMLILVCKATQHAAHQTPSALSSDPKTSLFHPIS